MTEGFIQNFSTIEDGWTTNPIRLELVADNVTDFGQPL